MSNGFSSKVDLLTDIKKCNEEGRQQQVTFIKQQAEMESACNLPDGPHYAKPGANPVHKESTGIRLKVENTFGVTTINGKRFEHIDKGNEIER